MPSREARVLQAPGWLVGLAAATALVVLCAYLRVVPDLAASAEDHTWERVFHRLSRAGLSGVFTNTAGTYRPLCGSFLLAEDALGLSYAAKHWISALMYFGNSCLLGALMARLCGVRMGVLTALVATTWLSADEVLVWLGGRCDLLWVSFALIGSHFALTVLRAARVPALPLVLATIMCAAACLTKEPGFVLPLLWLTYAVYVRSEWRRMWSAVAISIVCLAWRTWVSAGLGPYIANYVSNGPLSWAAQGTQALGTLSLGTGPDAGPLMYLLGAIATLGALGLVLQRCQTRARVAMIGVLGLLLGPCALLFASRTLYPAVLVLAGMISVVCCSGEPPRRFVLAAFLVWQMGSATVGLASWQRGYVDRRASIAALARISGAGERLLLLAPRGLYAGRPLGVIADADVFEGRAIGTACRAREQAASTRSLSWHAPRLRLDTSASPTHRARVTSAGACRVEVAPLGMSCAGAGGSSWAHEVRHADGSSSIGIDASAAPLVLVYTDLEGELRTLRCPR